MADEVTRRRIAAYAKHLRFADILEAISLICLVVALLAFLIGIWQGLNPPAATTAEAIRQQVRLLLCASVCVTTLSGAFITWLASTLIQLLRDVALGPSAMEQIARAEMDREHKAAEAERRRQAEAEEAACAERERQRQLDQERREREAAAREAKKVARRKARPVVLECSACRTPLRFPEMPEPGTVTRCPQCGDDLIVADISDI